jgi:hypothetical protein
MAILLDEIVTTDVEHALSNGIIPWVDIEYRTSNYWVFKPMVSSTDGHLIIVPVMKNIKDLTECYRAAYQFGFIGHEAGKWLKYKIVQVVGDSIIDYPFVEMIPLM